MGKGYSIQIWMQYLQRRYRTHITLLRGRNFALTSRTIVQPNGGTREVPCYLLTKTECLHIATKFNDEARVKLVLRDMGIQ